MAQEKSVDSWQAVLKPELREIAGALRQLILVADTSLAESIKWGNPVFSKKGNVCYLAATKAYVSLGFFNGAALFDPGARMEGTGKKMRHVKVKKVDDILRERFAAWIGESVALNESSAR